MIVIRAIHLTVLLVYLATLAPQLIAFVAACGCIISRLTNRPFMRLFETVRWLFVFVVWHQWSLVALDVLFRWDGVVGTLINAALAIWMTAVHLKNKDDRWKKLRRKAKEKIVEKAGRLAVVPVPEGAS